MMVGTIFMSEIMLLHKQEEAHPRTHPTHIVVQR